MWKWKDEGEIFDDIVDMLEQYMDGMTITFYTHNKEILNKILFKDVINGMLCGESREYEIPCIQITEQITDLC